MRALLLAALAALVFVPAADGAFQMDAELDTSLVAPGETKPVAFHVSDDCQDLLARAPLGADGVPFGLEAKTSSGYIVTLGPGTGTLPLEPCLRGASNSTATVEWTMALQPDAPGLEPLKSDVQAALASAPQGDRFAIVSLTVAAKAEFAVQADVANGKGRSADGERTRFAVGLTNLGNCKVTVAFEVTDEPGHGSVKLPDPVVLDTQASGLGNQQTVTIGFEADAGAWATQGIDVTLTPSAFTDSAIEGNATTVHLLVRNGNVVERSTPSPSLPVSFLALAALAFGARRRA